MKKDKKIIFLVILLCVIMAIFEVTIKPNYIFKSVVKLILFLIIPITISKFFIDLNIKSLFKIKKQGIIFAGVIGISVFTVIISAYLLLKNYIDFSQISKALTANLGVNKFNFPIVAIYISFVNSLLEEFFFRGIAFLKLKENINKKFAYFFSALAFALYHISMMFNWFNPLIFILSLVGLFIGGIIFNYFNDKYENIYISWVIHMFANFAINTIGYILFLKS